VDEATAKQIADAELQRSWSDGALDIRIDASATRYLNGHWIFFYDTEEFLRTGKPDTRLAGNAPIVVRARDGAVWLADIHRTIEDQLS
jgi:hypothetical protein